jgi:DNA-binding MarR family transcriptional regulator
MREAFLSLTPAGRAIYEELAPIAHDFAKFLTEAISPADRPAFDRAIDSLTKRAATLAPALKDENE